MEELHRAGVDGDRGGRGGGGRTSNCGTINILHIVGCCSRRRMFAYVLLLLSLVKFAMRRNKGIRG